MTEHLEIERKFEAASSFALPDLTHVEGVGSVADAEEQQLEATYFDTPDLRLLRARVTLRRRTGGPDAGWHVKLPASAGARRELHRPLGRAIRTVPKAVLTPLLGLLGTAAPVPVATLSTRRTVHRLLDGDGRVLAEVADDAVVGTALPAVPGEPATVTTWREVEVELADGDETLLDAVGDALAGAGAWSSASPSKVGRVLEGRLGGQTVPPTRPWDLPAPDTGKGPKNGRNGRNGKRGKKAKKRGERTEPAPTAGDVVLAAVAGQLTALREADLAVRTDRPEGVHDFRVACRRIRSILAAFRSVLAREQTDPLRDELQWVGAQLSAARDGEVALEHLRALVSEQPPELVLGPVAARIQQVETADHEAGSRRAARALSDRRYLRLLDALDGLLADPPVTEQAAAPAPAVLAEAVRRSGKRLRRDIAASREAEGAEHEHLLHESRKAAKRVRYTAEVAASQFGAPATELVDCMKRVQDLLGESQDTVVTREYALRLGREAFAAGENAWTYGRLHALEEARAARAQAEFWALEPRTRAAIKAVTSLG